MNKLAKELIRIAKEISASKKLDVNKVKNFLDSHQTFYTKKWQNNNFYPIDKYVWDDNEKQYRCSLFKTHGAHLTGWDNDSLARILVNNVDFISPEEFHDDKNFDDEGCELIG